MVEVQSEGEPSSTLPSLAPLPGPFLLDDYGLQEVESPLSDSAQALSAASRRSSESGMDSFQPTSIYYGMPTTQDATNRGPNYVKSGFESQETRNGKQQSRSFDYDNPLGIQFNTGKPAQPGSTSEDAESDLAASEPRRQDSGSENTSPPSPYAANPHSDSPVPPPPWASGSGYRDLGGSAPPPPPVTFSAPESPYRPARPEYDYKSSKQENYFTVPRPPPARYPEYRTAPEPRSFWRPPPSPPDRPFVPLPPDQPVYGEVDLLKTYREGAVYADNAQVANWDRDMDMILVFAGLFSAVLTAFLIESYQRLEPDQEEQVATSLVRMTAILTSIAMNQISPNSSTFEAPPEEQPFSPLLSDLWINGLWFMSLSLSLTAAMSAMLVKQWLQQYLMGLNASSTSDDTYHIRRQLRYNNLLSWRVPTIIAALPLLLYAAVALFLLGLVVLVWKLNQALGIAIAAALGTVAILEIVAVMMPLVYAACPYKTSFVAGFRRLIYYTIFGWWDLCFQFCVRLSQIYGERWSILAEQLAKRKPRYSVSFLSVETEHIKSRKLELELDGLMWLFQQAPTTELANYTLQAIPEYEAHDMPQKLLQFGMQEQLHEHALVKLPDEDDEFWTDSSMYLSSHVIALSKAVPYIRSLLHVWMREEYLSKHHPPAISERDALSMHEAPLFPGWLKLWRILYSNYDARQRAKATSIRQDYAALNDTTDSVFLDKGVSSLAEFASVICAETLYSHLHPTRGTPDMPIRTDIINILDVMKDAVRIQMYSEAFGLLFDTLAHSLARLLEKPEERERILLVLIVHGERLLDKTLDPTWVKIVHCLRLLTFDDLETRKQIILHPRSKSRPSVLREELCDDLHAFYESFSASQVGVVENIDKILKEVLRWLVFVQKFPLKIYRRSFFIGLPPIHAEAVLSAIRDLVLNHNPKPMQPDSLDRLCGMLQGWYIEAHTPTSLRIKIVDILASLLLHDFDSDTSTYESVLRKTLEFFAAILSSTNRFRDFTAANHICRVCASLFAFSFSLETTAPLGFMAPITQPIAIAPRQPQHTTRGYGYDDMATTATRRPTLILEKMHECSVIKTCARFLSSRDRRTMDTVLEWDQLLRSWKVAIMRKGESDIDSLNVDAYEQIRSAVGAFPTRARTPKSPFARAPAFLTPNLPIS